MKALKKKIWFWRERPQTFLIAGSKHLKKNPDFNTSYFKLYVLTFHYFFTTTDAKSSVLNVLFTGLTGDTA